MRSLDRAKALLLSVTVECRGMSRRLILSSGLAGVGLVPTDFKNQAELPVLAFFPNARAELEFGNGLLRLRRKFRVRSIKLFRMLEGGLIQERGSHVSEHPCRAIAIFSSWRPPRWAATFIFLSLRLLLPFNAIATSPTPSRANCCLGIEAAASSLARDGPTACMSRTACWMVSPRLKAKKSGV
jgi:hypothetical protein